MAVLTGILLALVTVVVWSLSDLISKVVIDNGSKWKLLFMGEFIGGFILFVVIVATGAFKIHLTEALWWLVLLGFIDFVGMYTFYESMRKKGAALSSVIVNAWALITVPLGIIFFKERLVPLQVLAIILIIGGVFVIALKRNEKLKIDHGFFVSIFSMIVWGLFFFLLKVPTIIFGALLVAMSVKLLGSFFAIPVLMKKRINLHKTKKKILGLMILVGIFDMAGLLFFNQALLLSPVSIVAPIIAAVPAFVSLFAVLILKEVVTNKQWAGIFITILGVVLISL
jgi:drug/metabolite transporter (DMT)-like permease